MPPDVCPLATLQALAPQPRLAALTDQQGTTLFHLYAAAVAREASEDSRDDVLSLLLAHGTEVASPTPLRFLRRFLRTVLGLLLRLECPLIPMVVRTRPEHRGTEEATQSFNRSCD